MSVSPVSFTAIVGNAKSLELPCAVMSEMTNIPRPWPVSTPLASKKPPSQDHIGEELRETHLLDTQP